MKKMGVIVDKSLNFSDHICSKVNSANRNLGIMFRAFTYMDQDMFSNLYKSIVRPHLDYAVCMPTWLHLKMYKEEPQN